MTNEEIINRLEQIVSISKEKSNNPPVHLVLALDKNLILKDYYDEYAFLLNKKISNKLFSKSELSKLDQLSYIKDKLNFLENKAKNSKKAITLLPEDVSEYSDAYSLYNDLSSELSFILNPHVSKKNLKKSKKSLSVSNINISSNDDIISTILNDVSSHSLDISGVSSINQADVNEVSSNSLISSSVIDSPKALANISSDNELSVNPLDSNNAVADISPSDISNSADDSSPINVDVNNLEAVLDNNNDVSLDEASKKHFDDVISLPKSSKLSISLDETSIINSAFNNKISDSKKNNSNKSLFDVLNIPFSNSNEKILNDLADIDKILDNLSFSRSSSLPMNDNEVSSNSLISSSDSLNHDSSDDDTDSSYSHDEVSSPNQADANDSSICVTDNNFSIGSIIKPLEDVASYNNPDVIASHDSFYRIVSFVALDDNDIVVSSSNNLGTSLSDFASFYPSLNILFILASPPSLDSSPDSWASSDISSDLSRCIGSFSYPSSFSSIS